MNIRRFALKWLKAFTEIMMAQLSDLTFDKMMARIADMKPEDVFYPRYEFKNEEEVKSALIALNKVGVKTVGFSNKEPLNTAAAASDEDYFISVHQMNFAFGEKQAKWVADNLNLIPNVETLDFSGCKVGDKNAALLLKALQNTNVTDLHLENTYLTSQIGSAFKDTLPRTKLKKLSIGNNYSMNDDAYAQLVAVLPETKIETLNLSKGNVADKSAAAFEKVLPESSLTSLNINSAGFSKDGMTAFVNGLKKSKLTDLNMSQMRHTEQTAAILTDALPELHVKKLRYDIWHTYSDEFYDKAAKSIRDPRCRLEQPFFGVSYASPQNAQKINSACEFLKSNVAYRLAITQKTKANAGKEPPEEMGLVDALENGFIEQALNRRPPLSSAVCMKEEKDGVSLLSAAIRAERLDTLFSSKNWNNAKEFAAAWDHVPPEHRWQLDGKDGRPSFPKIKNEVMKKAVLFAVRKNNVRN